MLSNIGDVSEDIHTYILVVWVDLALKKICFLGARPRAPYMGIPTHVASVSPMYDLLRKVKTRRPCPREVDASNFCREQGTRLRATNDTSALVPPPHLPGRQCREQG